MAIRELNIRNFAIIKQLEIEIDDGLTVVTGETGAGKSIMLDALQLLLGARAETEMVRHGENQCEISALFDISKLSIVQAWLEHKDFNDSESSNADEPQYCLIRRVVRINKPTKCYINDQPTTLSSLKELGLLLVDLHGQHEHQSLLRRATQRQIIDQFAHHPEELNELAKLASQIRRLEKELSAISLDNSANADKIELLSFQLEELNETDLHDGEYEQLSQDQSVLSNAQELIQGIQQAQDQLFDSEEKSISTELGKQISNLEELAKFDSSLLKAVEQLNSALSLVEETKDQLGTSLSRIEQDPERLSEIDQRLQTILNLARKHRCTESELIEKHSRLQSELENLQKQGAEPGKLKDELASLITQYNAQADSVSERRQAAAKTLSQKITEQMQDLGMRGGFIDIQVEPQYADTPIISEHGIDQIEYMVSTNHGMPAKMLQKTASGGELSRISLAIQVIASQQSSTPSLVFDEVDVGVGGKVAEIVGERLKSLGTTAQVICITHLAQVAAHGDQHLAVDKVSSSYETYSTLINLDHDQRIEELARMLGGKEITERSRAHAKEMLEGAEITVLTQSA